MAIDPTWIQAGSTVLGKALQSSSGPSRAESGGYVTFDNSGFVVATGRASAKGAQELSPWLIALLGGGLLLWALKKR